MIERILQLRSKSVPIIKIASECNLTVGQVKYQLRKLKEKTMEQPDSLLLDETSNTEASVPKQKAEETKQGQTHTPWRLSSFYGENIMRIMPQSPTVLFAYWEITWNRMRMVGSYLQTDFHSIQKGIRLYDVSDRYFDGANAHSHRDIIVKPEASSWYITDVQPGRTYIADFGLFHEGRFCPIMRSKPVLCPRNTRAQWGDPLIPLAPSSKHPAWFENFTTYSIHSK